MPIKQVLLLSVASTISLSAMELKKNPESGLSCPQSTLSTVELPDQPVPQESNSWTRGDDDQDPCGCLSPFIGLAEALSTDEGLED